MVTAIVLAAGSSRRMGDRNKLLLPYRGKTVLSHTLGTILSAGIGDIIVVTGHEAASVQTAMEDLPVRIVHNPRHESGMTSSIQAGVGAATGDSYMICLADMVLITREEYGFILDAFCKQRVRDPRCICLPEYQGKNGNPVVFSFYYRQELMRHPEPEGCKGLVQSHPQHQYRVSMNSDHILRDMDNPEQYLSLSLQP